MNLAGLVLKNAAVKKWRSMTLGFFIFIVAFMITLSNSLITSTKNKVEKVILNGFTGHIQLRSEQSQEGDMVMQYNPGWDALKPIGETTAEKINEILEMGFPDVRAFGLIRRSVNFEAGDKKMETMLIGISQDMSSYRDAFLLAEGRFLDPNGTHEILLTQEQASALGAGVGDFVKVTTKNRYGLHAESYLEVVGIGDYIMLSLFSYNANYTQSGVVGQLADYKEGEVTDFVLYVPDNRNTTQVVEGLSENFDRKGLKYSITADEKLTSEDLKVRDLSFDDDTAESEIKISLAEEMGKTFKGVGEAMFVVLNILVIFLMVIVGVLIFNLVYMTGIERFRETGTLRAIGYSKMQVISIFMGEVLSISVLFSTLGMLASTGIVFVLNRFGAKTPIPFLSYILGETLYLDVNPDQLVFSLFIIFGFTAISSFFPAYKACSVDPAETIRTV